jgi:hypothetical protein
MPDSNWLDALEENCIPTAFEPDNYVRFAFAPWRCTKSEDGPHSSWSRPKIALGHVILVRKPQLG